MVVKELCKSHRIAYYKVCLGALNVLVKVLQTGKKKSAELVANPYLKLL